MSSKNTKFIESLYNVDLDEVTEEDDNNKQNILNVIALIVIGCVLIDNIIKLNVKERNKYHKELLKLINTSFTSSKNITNNKTELILTTVADKVYKHYGGELSKKQIKEIVKNSFKGKNYSKRIWNNSNRISKLLKKDINKFLKGKISVNDIKNHVERKFKSNQVNINRLVDTEINRVINEVTLQWCSDNGIKKVIRISELDNKTCKDCIEYDGSVYDIDKIPIELPAHPNCRCFYEPYYE
ncbi:MAG: minor capsid protein [Sarcina sp.]